MKKEIVEREVITAIFNGYRIFPWNENVHVLVYDSTKYPVRDFSVVFDEQKNIKMIGYDMSEAYYGNQPPKHNYDNLYYIRDYDKDNYIFFNSDFKILGKNIVFTKYDCINGEICAKSEDIWYVIKPDEVTLEEA